MTKILDCTIRDGGHLNGWNFSNECVKYLYQTAVKSGVDFFETGYKNSPDNYGKFYFCEDDFLFSIFKPDEHCKISVMIDAGKSDLKNFKTCTPNLTPVSHVRVSAYPDKLENAFELCEGLLEKNYKVFLNLMAISTYCENDFKKIKNFNAKDYLESVYFADSFGSLFPKDVEKFYGILKDTGIDKISLHSHNNLQLAFANTIKAVELDFYSVDASLTGMGRGAGNLPMELLLGYLRKFRTEKYNPVFYMEAAEKYFKNFYEKMHWGYTLPYLISGLENVHPSYVRELIEKNYSCSEMEKSVRNLKEKNIISYAGCRKIPK